MIGMRRDSAWRLAASAGAYLAGAVAAVITARWLGPSGRGVVALIGLVSTLFTRCAVLSLGEAAVVLVGKARVGREQAIGVVLCASALTSVAAVFACGIVTVLLLTPDSASIWAAVAIGAVSIPLFVFADVFSQLMLLDQRVIRASVVFAVGSMVTLAAIAILVIPLDLGIPGAVAGTAIGALASLGVAVRTDLLARPRWSRRVLRQALAYGIPAESGVLLTQAAARLDLVVVFVLMGSASAGIYSIALTIGALVNLVPAAIAFAAFPRLAREAGISTALPSIARLARMSAVGALLSAVLIGVMAAITISPLFGPDFDSALAPALILTAAGVPWGVQWTLARAVAALGKPRLLPESYGVALAVMLTLDFALIPGLDLLGAAAASAIGTVAGLAVCVRALHREGLELNQLVRRPSHGA